VTGSKIPHGGDDAVIGVALRRSALVLALGAIPVIVALMVWPRTDDQRVIAKQVAAPLQAAEPSAAAPVIPFTDITEEAGITFVHTSGASGEKLLPETMGSGAAFFDVDSDGDQDVVLVNSDDWPWERPSRPKPTMGLFINDGRGRFTEATRQWGLAVPIYGMGVAVGDVEGDGDPDLFITAVGRNRLFLNEGSRFRDVTGRAGVAGDPEAWSSCAGFFDADSDGDLDLIVGNYVIWSRELDFEVGFTLNGTDRAYGPPTSFAGTVPWLYLNDGSGSFREVGEEAGLRVVNPATGEPVAKSLGFGIADLDDDGRLDVLVANDTVRNFLFRNLGGGRFTEIGASAGVGFDAGGNATGAMGVDVADFRNDGHLGFAVGNFANEMTSLYVALQDPWVFADEAVIEGIGSASRLRLSFGVLFLDADLDGRLDLLTVNGHIEDAISQVQSSQTHRQPAQLFWNTGGDGGASFVPLGDGAVGDLARPVVGRGATTADIDGDGDLDLLISGNGERARLLRNDQSLNHHWLRVILEGDGPNPGGIGAWVEVLSGGLRQRRQVMPARSYLSQVELPVTFGLGDRSGPVEIQVTWPDGTIQAVDAVSPDQVVTVRRVGE
jgi:hypothetical protein